MSRLPVVLAVILCFSAEAAAGDNPEIAIALHVQDYYEACGLGAGPGLVVLFGHVDRFDT